ncbi:hypothetical protein OO015_00440 [Thermomicrobium sp. 4228-Ro]|uniref:hypothetical protein n=1 Tax=Thermomicrobium sp. 4228-Ro TaxID=2993937 RepID=UPI00224931E6|nr:hypothetical protein [Thermomicrobium sp. 4228-Ro]MCX2725975.1 hypothetical protein [Thermomicrobium sp. 4228-Ro]
MNLQHWYDKFEYNLRKTYDFHRHVMKPLEVPAPPSVHEALPLIEGYLQIAGAYFDIPITNALELALVYPSTAAEVWAAAVMHKNPHVAREKARAIVADAAAMGYLNSLSLDDIIKYTYEEFREKQLEEYEAMLAARGGAR